MCSISNHRYRMFCQLSVCPPLLMQWKRKKKEKKFWHPRVLYPLMADTRRSCLLVMHREQDPLVSWQVQNRESYSSAHGDILHHQTRQVKKNTWGKEICKMKKKKEKGVVQLWWRREEGGRLQDARTDRKLAETKTIPTAALIKVKLVPSCSFHTFSLILQR